VILISRCPACFFSSLSISLLSFAISLGCFSHFFSLVAYQRGRQRHHCLFIIFIRVLACCLLIVVVVVAIAIVAVVAVGLCQLCPCARSTLLGINFCHFEHPSVSEQCNVNWQDLVQDLAVGSSRQSVRFEGLGWDGEGGEVRR